MEQASIWRACLLGVDHHRLPFEHTTYHPHMRHGRIDRMAIHKGGFTSASTAVYRTTPDPLGSTTTLTAGAATGSTEVWLECHPNTTASATTYLLIAPKNYTVKAADLLDQ